MRGLYEDLAWKDKRGNEVIEGIVYGTFGSFAEHFLLSRQARHIPTERILRDQMEISRFLKLYIF